jgi:hypothetical protein
MPVKSGHIGAKLDSWCGAILGIGNNHWMYAELACDCFKNRNYIAILQKL